MSPCARILQWVASDHTWSCTQALADRGYSWTAQVGDGPVSGPVDFIVNTGKYPAPTIDHTPSPTNDAKPILTGTVSSALVDRGFYLEVTENGGEDRHRQADAERGPHSDQREAERPADT